MKYAKDSSTGDIHALSPVGYGEHTLCGDAFDGCDGEGGHRDVKRGPVTCKRCIEVVLFCRSLKVATGGGK